MFRNPHFDMSTWYTWLMVKHHKADRLTDEYSALLAAVIARWRSATRVTVPA